jgi:hypothetical protein
MGAMVDEVLGRTLDFSANSKWDVLAILFALGVGGQQCSQ